MAATETMRPPSQFGHGGLRDARQAHGLNEVVDAPGRHAGNPCLLDHRHQRLLDGLPRLQEAWKVAAGPQLRDLQVERAQPRVEAAFPIAVAVGAALARSFVAACADQTVHVGLHQDLQDRLGDRAQEVAVIRLLQRLD
jgi:hypothetical protein